MATDLETSRAAARLLARLDAARAMLAALKALMDNSHVCGVDCDPNRTCPNGDAALAAIAQAEAAGITTGE
jgi:hypothetical protein